MLVKLNGLESIVFDCAHFSPRTLTQVYLRGKKGNQYSYQQSEISRELTEAVDGSDHHECELWYFVFRGMSFHFCPHKHLRVQYTTKYKFVCSHPVILPHTPVLRS
jgi:hypothetical protein